MEIMEFNGFDDAMEKMQKSEKKASVKITETQKRILKKAQHKTIYWARLYNRNLLIIGKSQTPKEQGETEALLEGLKPETCEYNELCQEVMNDAEKMINRGYLFGTASSVIEPEGELGDTHVSKIAEISEQTFNRLKEVGWSLETCLYEKGAKETFELAFILDENLKQASLR